MSISIKKDACDDAAMCTSTICGGIVTFNPDLVRLSQNVNAIKDQVSEVFIVDNGSSNADAIETFCNSFKNVQFIHNGANEGIAAALNQIMNAGKQNGYRAVLTLDQDSVSTPGMVEALASHMDDGVGIVAPQVIDRNKDDFESASNLLDGKVYRVKQAARKGILTSGSLTSVAAWEYVGGFDDNFFIDYVDYDFNKRLLLEGFSLIRTGETCLIHECGKAVPTWLFTPRKGQDGVWRLERFFSFGHSPFRCYYKARNRVLYSRKYRGYPGSLEFEGIAQIVPQVLLTVLFEKGKKEKLSAFCKGIRDGLNANQDRYVLRSAQ